MATMSTVNVTLPVNTAPAAAPLLLGFLWNWGLFGVLSVQVYLYYLSFPKDGRVPKTLIYSVYAIELAQIIIITRDAYAYYASGFGNIDGLNAVQTAWLSIPIFSGIIGASVEIYYAYRISILSGSRIPLVIISAIALMEGSAAIASGIQALKLGQFSELIDKAFVTCLVWHAGSAACDVVIALCMTFLLVRMKTKVRKTKAVLARLVWLTIETGILTAMTATLDLILFVTFPTTAYHVCVGLLLTKMYSNTLMVLFNCRIRIVGGRGQGDEDDSINTVNLVATRPSTALRLPMSPRGARPTTAGGRAGIHIEQETWIHSDREREDIPMEAVDSTSKKTLSLA